MRASFPGSCSPHCRSTNFLITDRFEAPFNSVSSDFVACKPFPSSAAPNAAITSPLSSMMVPPMSKTTSLIVPIVPIVREELSAILHNEYRPEHFGLDSYGMDNQRQRKV